MGTVPLAAGSPAGLYLAVREISMGLEPIGNVIVVVHTTVISAEQEWTRLISARKASRTEAAMYFERRGNV